MVKKIKYLIIIITLFACSSIFPQGKDRIKSKQTELSRIKSEILSLESQLKANTTKEKQSNIALENYNKQSFLLNTLINRLREEEQVKLEDIEFTLQQIEYIEKEIKILQANYSKYVISLIKKGRMMSLLCFNKFRILSAGSFKIQISSEVFRTEIKGSC